MTPALQARIDKVHAQVDIVAVVSAGGVRLSKGANPRGKCPFHGSKSDSFTVYPDSNIAKCWGCPWVGDVIKFVSDNYGLSFIDALKQLEEEAGLDGLAAQPVRYQKSARATRDRPHVDSATVARFIWRGAAHRPDAVRPYLRARGVPASMLGDHRLGDVRFHALAPVSSWAEGRDGPEPEAPKAPAICALIRRPVVDDVGMVSFVPIGLHVTYLAPTLDAKMVRHKRNGEAYPDRKMMGESQGGCVLLGAFTAIEGTRAVRIDGFAPLFPGEGIETVLSGMAIAGADDRAMGLATLSLGNLEGKAARWKNGVLPLFDIRPDPGKAAAVAFPHWGPVTGLIDADMKPLRGPRDRRTGAWLGLPVVERRGGPIVRRAITTAERAEICAALFVRSWRAAGCRRVTAMRPRMGLDFNDAIREGL